MKPTNASQDRRDSMYPTTCQVAVKKHKAQICRNQGFIWFSAHSLSLRHEKHDTFLPDPPSS